MQAFGGFSFQMLRIGPVVVSYIMKKLAKTKSEKEKTEMGACNNKQRTEYKYQNKTAKQTKTPQN